jgi:Sulfatase
VSLRVRTQMRPVLYPAAILVAFVLNALVDSGMNPYAATRPLIVALLIGLVAAWLGGLATADRDRAGVLAMIVVLMVLGAGNPGVVSLGLAALAMVGLQPFFARRARPRATSAPRVWSFATRVLTLCTVILLVAVGVKAIQLGRMEVYTQDLVAGSPLHSASAAAGPTPAAAPNIVFILLDGYPRADKLLSEFGIDNSSFARDLRARDFVVADHSRSNETDTELTLAQMFNYESAGDVATLLRGPAPLWRVDINNGAFFGDLHRLGYETIAVSPGYERVALRSADVFVDTGQLNEFEWAVASLTGFPLIADAILPNFAADQDRSRILDAFRVAGAQAFIPGTGPKLLFVHVVSPHSPQVFGAAGVPLDVPGFALPNGDSQEIARYGFDGYSRRLAGQLQFLDQQTLHLVDTVVAADPGAVVVVFSDHGTGAPPREPGAASSYPDLRTANLLAVRSPGQSGIIDDRSTLANLLPRLLRAYTGSGPADVPDTIFAWTGSPSTSFFFQRPD